jgi:hypothetical protein
MPRQRSTASAASRPTSKHAINGLTRVTGGSPEVRAQAISAIPQGRAGDPREVAEAVLFLALGDAGFITGQIIKIDGGFTAQ